MAMLYFLDSKWSVILNPIIILLALNFPSIFYRNKYTRYGTTAVVALVSGAVIHSQRFERSVVGYTLGLFEAWFVVWAMVLIVIHNPSQQFCRTVLVSQATSSRGPYLIWQAFPQKVSWQRFLWTLDLLVSLRGIGWNYRQGSYDLPLPINNAMNEACSTVRGPEITAKGGKPKAAALLMSNGYIRKVLARLTLEVLWVYFCQTNAFPQIKSYYSSETKDVKKDLFYDFLIRSWAMFTSLTTTMASIDMFNTSLIILTSLCDVSPYIGLYGVPWAYPSPWGSLSAVLRKGIVGFWTESWHDYFSYGFRSIPEFLTTGQKNRILIRIVRLFLGFTLSGIMHLCGSCMIIGTYNPSFHFIFFVFQAIGITVHSVIYGLCFRKHPFATPLFNVIFCYVWLYGTQRFLFDDFILGDFWQRKIQVGS